MGITQFNPLLQILFPDAVKILEERDTSPITSEYDHVLLDLNGLLYKLRTRDQTDEMLILATLKYLERLLQQFHPRTSVVLALDGPCASIFVSETLSFEFQPLTAFSQLHLPSSSLLATAEPMYGH